MKNRIRAFAVLAITFLLLYWVVRKVGLDELRATLAGANWLWILVSVIHAPILIFTGVIKWKILLHSQEVDVPLKRLYLLYLVGKFFNNFLPSNVGGDVVRGFELGHYTKNGAVAMASVFMERFTGLMVLVILAILSFLTNLRLMSDIRLTLAMAFAVAGLLGVVWLVLDSRPLDLLKRWVKIPIVQKYIPKLEKFHASLTAYRNHRRALVLSTLWSVIFMLLAITNVYSSARAFHFPVPLVGVASIVPVILVVSMVPLTFNGLGIQEWAYVILFTWIGLPASVGLSTIVLIRAKDLFSAIIGGLLYPVLKFSKDKRTQQDVLEQTNL